MATGCFEEPKAIGEDESGSSSESSSSSDEGTAPTTSSSTSSSESSTVADASSSSDASSSTTAVSDDDGSSSSSTGEAPCGCEGDELLCESFEPPFDPDVAPWSIPDSGAEPTVVDDPLHCGASALRTALQPAAEL
ncbi:MAG TPA: hypothetical protein VG755_15575, partial [Nannocystaceae bacterium]|nr:hypothetical protein [Nannocystaceae bacterium]